jgi:hypothetical protein
MKTKQFIMLSLVRVMTVTAFAKPSQMKKTTESASAKGQEN